MEVDPVLVAAVNVGLKLAKLVEQAEQDFIKSPEAEREIRRAYVVGYMVARDTWAQFIAALGAALQEDIIIEVDEDA